MSARLAVDNHLDTRLDLGDARCAILRGRDDARAIRRGRNAINGSVVPLALHQAVEGLRIPKHAYRPVAYAHVDVTGDDALAIVDQGAVEQEDRKPPTSGSFDPAP